MKAPIKVGIPPGMRVLYVESHKNHYRLWLHTNNRILGTYLALWDNGKMERVTVRADEGDQVDLIKPANGAIGAADAALAALKGQEG